MIHKENLTVNCLKSPELWKSNCWAIQSSGERANKQEERVNDLEISSSLKPRFERSAREEKLSWDSEMFIQ